MTSEQADAILKAIEDLKSEIDGLKKTNQQIEGQLRAITAATAR